MPLFSADDSDALDDGEERDTWMLAPVVCVALLTAGVVAGVVRALRAEGSERCAGVPLPRCGWLTSRWAVRIAAWGALAAGLFGLLTALRRFLLGWQTRIPPYLVSLTLFSYVLLASAPLLALGALRLGAQGAMEARKALRQAAKAALLGGLAAGLAVEVLCNAVASESIVSREWREGCAMLGASSGLLLLGLYAAQADGSWNEGPRQGVAFDEEGSGDARGGTSRSRNSFGGWHGHEEDSSRNDLVVRHDSNDSHGSDDPRRAGLSNGGSIRPAWAAMPPAWGTGQVRFLASEGQTPRRHRIDELGQPLLSNAFSGPLVEPFLLRLPSDLRLSGAPLGAAFFSPAARDVEAWGGCGTLGPPGGACFPREPALPQPVLAS